MSFNVNSVDRRREHVHSAQLHLFKKRTAASSSGVQLCAFTSAIAAAAAAAADQWQVSTGSHVGWQVYDVTAALISAASAPPPANQLLFHLESLNKTLPLDRILRTDPAPFLVVFSKDTTNQTWTPQSTPSSLIRNASASRKARSIDDNELPDLDSLRASEGDLDLVGPETGPSILKARPRGGGTNQKNKIKVTPGDDGAGSGIVTGSSNAKSTLSYRKKQSAPLALSHYNSGHGSRSKSRKPKRRHRKLPDTWHLNQQQHVNDARQDVPEDASRSLCQKRKLVVDFAEIGWGEWIISPKTFEAHYCAGRCPFPLTKELNPTNHATIQSIVHAIGTHPDVPAACCVPDVLSSLTLLYFDDNRNVVLKNYPSMTAETCACR